MKTQFELICMTFDGHYITDSKHETIEQAEEASSEMGSKWFFYPFHFIVKGETVKETGEGLINMQTKESFLSIMFKNKRINTVVKWFKMVQKYCEKNKIEADPYEFEELLIDAVLNNCKLI